MSLRQLATRYAAQHANTLPDIGNEGFVDGLKRLVGLKPTATRTSPPQPTRTSQPKKVSAWGEILPWLESALDDPKGTLANQIESDTNVIISADFAPYFLRGSRQVTDVLKEVSSDANAYNGLATKNMPQAMKIFHFMRDAVKEMDAFVDKYPQGDAPEEYMKMMNRLISKQPKSVIETFQEPSVDFLGYGRTPFALKTHRLIFVEPQRPRPSTVTIVLPRLSPKEAADLLATLKVLYQLAENISAFVDAFPVIDFTDQPTRAYIRDLSPEQDKQLSQFKYAHQDEYDNSITLYDNVGSRAFHLALAYAHYLKKSLGQ